MYLVDLLWLVADAVPRVARPSSIEDAILNYLAVLLQQLQGAVVREVEIGV
jgi:hypothetical protein